jgi:hypothetical protein
MGMSEDELRAWLMIDLGQHPAWNNRRQSPVGKISGETKTKRRTSSLQKLKWEKEGWI